MYKMVYFYCRYHCVYQIYTNLYKKLIPIVYQIYTNFIPLCILNLYQLLYHIYTNFFAKFIPSVYPIYTNSETNSTPLCIPIFIPICIPNLYQLHTNIYQLYTNFIPLSIPLHLSTPLCFYTLIHV